MKLLLFDIDGTLIHTNDAGRLAISAAVEKIMGHTLSRRNVSFAGKTDPMILSELLRLNGYDPEKLRQEIEDIFSTYARLLHESLSNNHIEVLPGVRKLLSRLAADTSIVLGIVTGNIERGAHQKLLAAGLDSFFSIGAYGSDSASRSALPPIAVRRAQTYSNASFYGKDVIIIGDTEHDITCGRGIGAFSVGVCTGPYTCDELAKHDPDVLFPDLTDDDLFYRQVLGLRGTTESD